MKFTKYLLIPSAVWAATCFTAFIEVGTHFGLDWEVALYIPSWIGGFAIGWFGSSKVWPH